jgi:hypothetical protein
MKWTLRLPCPSGLQLDGGHSADTYRGRRVARFSLLQSEKRSPDPRLRRRDPSADSSTNTKPPEFANPAGYERAQTLTFAP